MLAQRPRPGFAAMLKEASLDPQRLTAASIGFGLAPRLNAAGRLGQTGKALDLLMCGSLEQAAPLAAELCELNRQRQNIEMEIWEEAQTLLPDIVPDQPIVLASDNWHQGVIGIAASRLAEQFYNAIAPIMPEHYARWDWSESAHKAAIKEFLKYAQQRPGRMLQFIKYNKYLPLTKAQMEQYFGDAMAQVGVTYEEIKKP